MSSLICYLFSFYLLLQPGYLSADNYPAPTKGQSGLFGYVDEKGRFVIEPQYEKAFPFQNGVARVKQGDEWILINGKGKRLTRSGYQDISDFRNGVALVSRKETARRGGALYGLVNEKGQEVVKPEYPHFTPDPNHALFIVGKEDADKAGGGKIAFGILDNEGEVVVPVQFAAVREHQFKIFAVKTETGKWQAYNATGGRVFDGTYTDIKDFDEELATVKKEGRWGIMHSSGKEVVKPNYRSIVKRTRHQYELAGFTQWKVINQQKDVVLSMEYEDVQPVSPVLYSYQIEGKKGLLNEKGDAITEPLFDEVFPFVKDMAVVERAGVYGVINPKGAVMLPLKYQAVRIDSTTTLLRVQENGQWGVLNKAGKTVVPVQYDEVRMQTYGMFTARKADKWQLLDAQGQPVGTNTFEAMDDFQFLHAVARAGGKSGLVNLKGGWTMEPRFDSLRIISDFLVLHQSEGIKAISNLHTQRLILEVDSIEPVHNYFRVIVKGKQGLYNARGQEVLPVVYDYISDFSQDSIITVVQGKKKGLMSIQGRPILAPDALYQELLVMTDQRVGVRIKNKYGFVDDRGRLRIANRYEGVGSFAEGYAAVKIQGGWGFIDKDENLRVQPFYTATMPFRGNVARVKRTHWGFVDKTGKETARPVYDSVQVLPTGRYLVWKDGRKGLVSEKGRELFAPRHDFVSDHANGFVLLGRNGKLGLSDTGGFDVLPVIYDRLYFNAAKNFYITGIEPTAQKYTYQP